MAARRWILAGLGTLSALTAVLFALAPVEQDETTYRWPADGTAESTLLPLFPYQPERLDVTIGCPAVEATGGGGLVLATTSDPDDGGLRVENRGGTVAASLHGSTVATAERCDWAVHAGPAGTTVSAGGEVIGHSAARPAVNGLFTDARGSTDLRVSVTPDTGYQSSPSVLKLALGALTVASVGALLLLLARWERPHVRRVRLLPPGWWRPRGPDLLVAAVLACWVLIGAFTVDDGYILTMLKAADDTGYIGNYFRWLNAPEAPFGWFYELYRPLVAVSAAAWWLRLPSLLLGLVGWLLVDRLLLRRCTAAPGPWVRWSAAVAFLAWYVPFDVGLRPEPWIVVGSLVVFALVERALATRSSTPLALGVLVAGATLAVTPTGVAAFMPFVAASPALVRLLRGRWLVSLTTLAGTGAAALLLMFHDQSWHAVREATEVRTRIGPSLGWRDEPKRYEALLDPTVVEGALNRRVPVLLTLLAIVALAVLLLARRVPGLAAGPTRRLLAGSALYLVALAFTPTKWTHHFGALAGLGALLVAVLVHTIARGALRAAWQRAALLALVAGVAALALRAPSRWWYFSNVGVKWADVPPAMAGVPLSTAVLGAGLVLAVAALFVRRVSPGPWIVAGLVGTLLLELGTMAYAVADRWDTFTVGRANIASLAGGSCGIEDWMQAEPDPAEGLLTRVAGQAAARGGFTVNGEQPEGLAPPEPYGTARYPVWTGTGSLRTGWYRLPERASDASSPPLVVPVAVDGRARLRVEFGGADGSVRWSERIELSSAQGEWEDARLDPGAAERVRLVASAERGWLGIGTPRLPRVVPSLELVPAAEPVTLDWISPFILPCREPASVQDGLTQPVRYRFTSSLDPHDIGLMSDDHGAGGPYAPLVQVAEHQRVPTYLRGDKLRKPVLMYRLTYPVPLRDVAVSGTRSGQR
ncbi:arabinosyltransferase C [Prauserella shujinwangii]|uniref:Arabinosyltransferase C n=1 Tax=Prauserella shujinwangii TaxID=1453103 RepID=A0A2T0LVU9_9PSEU|nr:arabinosyltransferase domain-containing protein [Prauserella shujinwangii]PRX47927.1 arabinosyltransferase C [Prauserella shujinwangii]